MKFEHFSHNGKILPIAQAQVPIAWLEYAYGFGVYENIRYAKGLVYFLEDHIERLMSSAKIIGLEHEFDDALVRRSVMELLEATQPEACNLKIMLIGGITAGAAQLYIECLNPFFPDRKLYRQGADLITCNYQRAFPQAKTLNMLQSYLAYRSAKSVGAYDALLVNRSGKITEGTRTNFFALKERTIVSPPEEDILLGVTRKAVLKAATKAGFEFRQAEIGMNEVANFDAAFITSTSSKILPVRSLDGQVIFEHPASQLTLLMTVFDDYLTDCRGVMR